MNLFETSIATTLGAIAGGIVAWLTKGRYESDSLQVKQAQAVLAMWQTTSENQNQEVNRRVPEVQVYTQFTTCDRLYSPNS